MQRELKKIILLGLILATGFILRSYNLDFPSIGYHNAKENDSLCIAQEMQRTNDYTTRRAYSWNAFEDNPTARMSTQPPLVSYQILLSWKFLGENLWGPRLINVFFGVGAILVMYFIALLLFKDAVRAMFCAFLLAIMPLAVFFSRNLQPESPAFFFMLLGSLFYLRFIPSLKKHNLVLGGLAFSIAGLYEFNFLIGALPFITCLPYKKIFRKNRRAFLNYALAFILPYLFIVAAILWLKNTGYWNFNDAGKVKIFEIFSMNYWQGHGAMIKWYIKGENFTFMFSWLALAGMLVAFLGQEGLLSRYILGSTLAIIPYCMLFSGNIYQDSYYQMPFLGLVCLSVVYAVEFFSGVVKKITKKEIFTAVMIIVIVLSLPFVRAAITKMYGTVFIGQDVAGESLKEFTKPDERIFLFTYPQGYAIARYARRYVGWVSDLGDFKQKEEKFNMRYICFYPAEFVQKLRAEDPSLFAYLRDNYHAKEAGLTEEPSRLSYIILEKGKPKPEEQKDYLQSFSGQRQLRTIYKLFGQYIFFYSLRT
jgi:4-amino-4-deoxy-L-arabinose transferase-like glycosyltransferase